MTAASSTTQGRRGRGEDLWGQGRKSHAIGARRQNHPSVCSATVRAGKCKGKGRKLGFTACGLISAGMRGCRTQEVDMKAVNTMHWATHSGWAMERKEHSCGVSMASCQRKDISPQPSMACVLSDGTEERKDLLGLCSAWKALPSSTEKMRGNWCSCCGVLHRNGRQQQVAAGWHTPLIRGGC